MQRFLYDVCEPYLRLFRRILPPLGPLDLSPIVAVIALVVLAQLVIASSSSSTEREETPWRYTPVELRHV